MQSKCRAQNSYTTTIYNDNTLYTIFVLINLSIYFCKMKIKLPKLMLLVELLNSILANYTQFGLSNYNPLKECYLDWKLSELRCLNWHNMKINVDLRSIRQICEKFCFLFTMALKRVGAHINVQNCRYLQFHTFNDTSGMSVMRYSKKLQISNKLYKCHL